MRLSITIRVKKYNNNKRPSRTCYTEERESSDDWWMRHGKSDLESAGRDVADSLAIEAADGAEGGARLVDVAEC